MLAAFFIGPSQQASSQRVHLLLAKVRRLGYAAREADQAVFALSKASITWCPK
jgi:hypothetical protein